MKSMKELSPETFDFFKEYWLYAAKYWIVENTEEFWNSFNSDTLLMTKEWGDNQFFDDIIQSFMHRTILISKAKQQNTEE